MKHFEDLWMESEKVTDDLKKNLIDSFSEISHHLEMMRNCGENMINYHMGMVIFNISSISRILNINTYLALQSIITDKKSEILDMNIA